MSKFDYKVYVDDALNYGQSFLPIKLYAKSKDHFNVKNLQKVIHKYAGRGNVSTYQNTMGELVILSNASSAKTDLPKKVTSAETSYEFKVGDAGVTVCGEPYVVLQKKRNGELLVNVKSHGSWKIGLRHFDGTCVRDYRNKHLYALTVPDNHQPVKKMVKRTIYLNVYPNTEDVFTYITEADAKAYAGDSAVAVAVPVTFEYAV